MCDKKKKQKVIQYIREAFKYSELYQEVFDWQSVGKKYKCENCEVVLAKSHFEVHHIDPVTPYDKFYYQMTDKEIFSRVFCDITNLQLLCPFCHKEITVLQKEERVRAKKKKIKK